MTAPTVSITESQIFTVVRAFLLSILPNGTPVIRGQDNRVPEPSAADFVVMIPSARERIATNLISYSDPFPAVPSTRTDEQQTQVTIQIDAHGPNSANSASVITTLFRSDVAFQAFAASGYDVQPLYTSEPRQLPFTNAEQQYEDRWSIDLVLQANIAMTTPQQFAGEVTPEFRPIEAFYRP